MRDYLQFKRKPLTRSEKAGVALLLVALLAFGLAFLGIDAYRTTHQPPSSTDLAKLGNVWAFVPASVILGAMGGLALIFWAVKERHCHDCAIMKEERRRLRDGLPMPGEKFQ